jgi:hypothetical protein
MPMKLTVADLKSLKALLRYARELIDDAANTSRAADDTARHIRSPTHNFAARSGPTQA